MALVLADFQDWADSADADKVYVAVGNDDDDNVSMLQWAIQHFSHHKFYIIRVHHTSEITSPSQEERDIDEAILSSQLDEYIHICNQSGIQAEQVCLVDTDSVEQGILALIMQHKIQKLVMGAASYQNNDTNMCELKSRKAIYVNSNAPPFCQISFIFRGDLVCTRVSSIDRLSSLNTQEMPRSLSTQEMPSSLSTQEMPRSLSTQEMPSSLSTQEMPSSLSIQGMSSSLSIQEISSSVSTQEMPSSLSTQEITMSPQSAMNFEDVYRANALEKLYTEELRKRKELEAELDMLKNRHEQTLSASAAQKLIIAGYEQNIKELENKVSSFAELVRIREEERDGAVKISQELIESIENLSSEAESSQFFLTLPSSEILKAAASESDQSSQLLCESEIGNIYKAVLYHTEVTLRFFPVGELLSFQHEVEILSKFRHPNMASLIGASQEPRVLVYEYLPNGSLEDRIRCKDDTPPLSWQTRIRIAVELCSALIFLHSHGVIHGALRPSCVLLDSNFTCKIIDFRFSRMVEQSSSTSSIHITEYTDPNVLETREVSPSSDVYSFGLMMLELLTGKPGFSVVGEVREALNDDSMPNSVMDTSAGDWSFLLAEQLAHLGLRCCDANSSARPNLKSDVWKVLEPMRLSSGSALSSRVGEAPSYFVCPILQEVMEDPHVATDGYTYEAEALRQWLDRGNGTSPMTNVELENTHLVPNRALRSAIQEWLQHFQRN